jgi:SAM-dependent methyltransferase
LKHEDHVKLLREGIPKPGGVWADFGSGEGAFTLALAELVGSKATIYSVDKDQVALARQEEAMQRRFPDHHAGNVHYLREDFKRHLDLPPLDGLVMANALHFQPHKEPLVRLLKGYLRPGGRMLLVEYNTDKGNVWVPYPLSFVTWKKVATEAGFGETRLLATYPSRFLGEIYSAISK